MVLADEIYTLWRRYWLRCEEETATRVQEEDYERTKKTIYTGGGRDAVVRIDGNTFLFPTKIGIKTIGTSGSEVDRQDSVRSADTGLYRPEGHTDGKERLKGDAPQDRRPRRKCDEGFTRTLLESRRLRGVPRRPRGTLDALEECVEWRPTTHERTKESTREKIIQQTLVEQTSDEKTNKNSDETPSTTTS
ncbi:hypothetical protein [Halosolutus halophilus]|uniref:DUF5828 family protein n=1 Tax=Halosolutus halophilus TaxID=1552990 RepID=UPI00223518E2|nr:hypothetical protein [Halosolutus halophilus]